MAGFATRSQNAATFFATYLVGMGGRYLDENGVPALDSPEAIKALEYYVHMQNTYGPSGVANYSFMEIQNDFMQEKLAMFIDTYHVSLRCQDPVESPNVYDKIGYGVIPGEAAIETCPFTWTWIIPKNSKNKELAAQLMCYIMTPEVGREINLLAPKQLFSEVFTYPAYEGYAESRPLLDVMMETFEYGNYDFKPRDSHTNEFDAIVNNAVQEALIGAKTPEQAFQDANAALKQLYGVS